MRVLFLDIDGVLNTDAFLQDVFDKYGSTRDPNKLIIQEKIELLDLILDEVPNLKFVIHSNWGKRIDSPEILEVFERRGFENADRCLGLTPKKMSSHKYHEISWWLRENPECNEFLVIDDEHVSFDWISEQVKRDRMRFVQTNSAEGLTPEIASKIVLWFTE